MPRSRRRWGLFWASTDGRLALWWLRALEPSYPRCFSRRPKLDLGPIPNVVRSAIARIALQPRSRDGSVRCAANYRRMGPKSSLGRRILGARVGAALVEIPAAERGYDGSGGAGMTVVGAWGGGVGVAVEPALGRRRRSCQRRLRGGSGRCAADQRRMGPKSSLGRRILGAGVGCRARRDTRGGARV